MEGDNIDYEGYIIKSIASLSGKYTPYQVFTDWITLTALAIQNSCDIVKGEMYQDREELYCNISQKYTADELKTMADMTGALTIELENRFGDILGDIYMRSGCGSKYTGQFFTPYHLSYLTAKLTYENQFSHLDENDVVEVNEPSTGGGGMMIALAQIMKECGMNYQKRLHVVAQDLDWNGVYMTYIQLSLLGVKAIIVQGDTLCEPYHKGYDERRIFRTPAEMGVLL